MCEYEEFDYEEFDNVGTPNSALLKKIKQAGFKPIGITIVMCEETFIFKGKTEAENAAKEFLPEGWWYDLIGFEETRQEYVKKFYDGNEEIAPTIYWLDKNFEPKK